MWCRRIATLLEVSSPGLDRPLRDAEDYRRFAGRRGQDRDSRSRSTGRRRSRAALLGVEGDDVLFESEGGKQVRLPLRLISRARLDVEF